MTAPTRDTCTTTDAADVVGLPGVVDPAAEFMPATVELPGPEIDPTRVRLTGLRPAEWDTEAACYGKATRQSDPWHPGPDGAQGTYTASARLACIGCPVRLQCLALGLALLPLGGVEGMYAGYTPAELRAIARARRQADRTVAQHGTRARRVAGCDCGPCKRAHAEYVAELRAQERYAESDAAEREVAVLPVAAPATVAEVPDLLSLLTEVPA